MHSDPAAQVLPRWTAQVGSRTRPEVSDGARALVIPKNAFQSKQ